MARRLSDPEFAEFLTENQWVTGLPPYTSKIVQWAFEQVLVYIGPDGSVYLSDVTGAPQLAAIGGTPGYGSPSTATWLDELPQATADTIAADAAAAGALVDSAGRYAAGVLDSATKAIGGAAGNLTAPLLSNLALPLIVVGIIGLVFLFDKQPHR